MNNFTETIKLPNLYIGIDAYCSLKDANNQYAPPWQKRLSISPYLACNVDMGAELASFISEKADSYLCKDAKYTVAKKRCKETGLPCLNLNLFIDVSLHDVKQVKLLLEPKLDYIFKKYIG